MNCPQNARDNRDNWVQTPTQICKPVECLSLSGCVCVRVCRTLYKACYWDSLRHARRLQARRLQHSHQLWNVSSTANSYKFMAGSTRDQEQKQDPGLVPVACPYNSSLYTPTTRSSSLSCSASPLVIQLKCKKILTLRAWSERVPNGACTPLCPLLAVIPCTAYKGCVCKYARKLIKVQPFICFIVRGQCGN